MIENQSSGTLPDHPELKKLNANNQYFENGNKTDKLI